MFILLVGSPGCGADRVRSFLDGKHSSLLDLTPVDEAVRFHRGVGDPMGLFVKLFNAHCEIVRLRALGHRQDVLLAYSLWEHMEVGRSLVGRLDAQTEEFFSGTYTHVRDLFAAPDAVLELRTDFQKAAAFAALRGCTLTQDEFEQSEQRLDEMIARFQAPVEQVRMEVAEIDPLLAEVEALYDSFQVTYNGPPTIWNTRLFRVGE